LLVQEHSHRGGPNDRVEPGDVRTGVTGTTAGEINERREPIDQKDVAAVNITMNDAPTEVRSHARHGLLDQVLLC
jgi:hypothetical protein